MLTRRAAAAITLLFPVLLLAQAPAEDTPVAGRYFGQPPPGMEPRKFAPGFISTDGYDITPTFCPTLDEVFFAHRPTEEGNDNRIYHSRMVNGRWQRPALASSASER